MIEKTIMDYIPPEQIGLLVTAVIGFFIAVLAYVRSLFRYFVKLQDEKLNAMRQERETEKAKLEAQIKKQEIEMQAKLDETQSGRETMRLLFSELAESRKEDKEIRASYERREAAHIQAMQGIEHNTAATFGLMKEMVDKLGKHQEADEAMTAAQQKIVYQNDQTHSKIEALEKLISGMDGKLDKLEKQHSGDKGEKMLKEIQGQLGEIRKFLESIRDDMKAQPPPNGVTTVTAANVTPNLDETIPLPALENEVPEQTLPENKDEKKEETK